MSKIGANLRKIRLTKGLSQAKFAEIFSLTRASVGAYEEGRAEPRVETVIEIAKYFSITLDALFTENITVNQLVDFDISKATKGNETNRTSRDKVLLNYVDDDFLINKELINQYVKGNKTQIQIEFPKWVNDADTFIDLNHVKIHGAKYLDIKALICLRTKKPKKNTKVVVITKKGIILAEYLGGISEVILRPLNSEIQVKHKDILVFFDVKFFINSNISTLQSLDLKLSLIEQHLGRTDK